MGSLKIFQPIRSSSLPDYTQHLYMNVLFYYIDLNLIIILTSFNKFIISLMHKKNAEQANKKNSFNHFRENF